jgi:predicted transcriptional regulator
MDMQDWFENLSKEEKEEIEIGLKQAENNEFTDHEEVMEIFLKYKLTTK